MLYSQLRSGKRIDLAQAVPLPRPLTLYIDPCNSCNYTCKYCFHSAPDYRERCGGYAMLSVPDARRIANQLQELGSVKTINFHATGEPLLNKQLHEIIELFSNVGGGVLLSVSSSQPTPVS